MKLGQLMDIPREIFFFKKYAENEAGKLVPDRFKKKSFVLGKSKWSAAWLMSVPLSNRLKVTEPRITRIYQN